MSSCRCFLSGADLLSSIRGASLRLKVYPGMRGLSCATANSLPRGSRFTLSFVVSWITNQVIVIHG
jgi:hypothetical protein